MNPLKPFLVFLLLTIFAINTSATPSEHYWENENLLGENTKYFYILKNCRYNPGSNYHFVDSVFLIERNKISGYVENKILLRIIDCEDETTMGDWVYTELFTNPLNLVEYQKEKSIHPIFKYEYDDIIKITEIGIIVENHTDKKLIMGLWRIGKFSDWIPQYISDYGIECCDEINVRIVNIFSSIEFVYISIDNNMNHMDQNCYHSIIPIPRNFLNEMLREIANH